MPCWLRWCASQRRGWDRRSTVSLRLVCCSGRACRRMRLISSSTRWCRTRPMARYYASPAARPHRRGPRKPVCGDRREPARVAGPSLHRGRADRAGGGFMGQSGTAVAGALGSGRSGRAALACARPNCDPARHASATSRGDQGSSCAHNSTYACQRVWSTGNEGRY